MIHDQNLKKFVTIFTRFSKIFTPFKPQKQSCMKQKLVTFTQNDHILLDKARDFFRIPLQKPIELSQLSATLRPFFPFFPVNSKLGHTRSQPPETTTGTYEETAQAKTSIGAARTRSSYHDNSNYSRKSVEVCKLQFIKHATFSLGIFVN